jgi:hypothetical protein
MIWGAVAGAVPALGSILAAPPADVISNIQFDVVIGHSIKFVILAFLGALVVRLNKETNYQKAFQLGIMAPAILIGTQSTSNLNSARSDLDFMQEQLQQQQISSEIAGASAPQSSATPGLSPDYPAGSSILDIFVPPVYAEPPLQKGDLREPSSLEGVWRGLTGSSSNNWFVIAGSYSSQEAAEAQARKLRAEGWNAAVGTQPERFNGYYPVLIGSNLPRDRALQIRDQAIRDGLPRDTFAARR